MANVGDILLCQSYLFLFDILILMRQVNWTKAATDFKPSGKPITGDSFRTSIQRMLKDKSGGSRSTGNTGKKRKPPAASPSPSAGNSNRKRAKKSNIDQANESAPYSPIGDEDTNEGDTQSLRGSQKLSPSPQPNSEAEDDDALPDHGLAHDDPNFFE